MENSLKYYYKEEENTSRKTSKKLFFWKFTYFWKCGKPDVLQFMGSQSDMTERLNNVSLEKKILFCHTSTWIRQNQYNIVKTAKKKKRSCFSRRSFTPLNEFQMPFKRTVINDSVCQLLVPSSLFDRKQTSGAHLGSKCWLINGNSATSQWPLKCLALKSQIRECSGPLTFCPELNLCGWTGRSSLVYPWYESGLSNQQAAFISV